MPHEAPDQTAKYMPTQEQIAEACAALRAVHEAAMKAGKGNNCRRHPTNIKTTSAGTGRRERGME
jgi:hypothetical protein